MSDLFQEQNSSEMRDEEQNEDSNPIRQGRHGHTVESEVSVGQNKTIHKNKYINKIKDILPQGSLKTISLKEIRDAGESDVRSMDKRERNKHSAKQSRDRKKLYIQILEQKQKALAKQLENRQKQLQQTKNYLQRVLNQSKTMSGFTASRHQMIKKLETLLERAQKGEDPTAEINTVIDGLRYRIGATGKERINTINEYFRQIVNLSLPALHRYMMWSAAEGKHLFNKDEDANQTDQWFQELQDTLHLSEEQRREIKSKQSFLKNQKELLEKLIRELKNIKYEIQEKSIELQDMIDGIREILSPIQCAHFILFIEKNKYRKELNLCQTSLEDQEPPLRKIVKPNESL